MGRAVTGVQDEDGGVLASSADDIARRLQGEEGERERERRMRLLESAESRTKTPSRRRRVERPGGFIRGGPLLGMAMGNYPLRSVTHTLTHEKIFYPLIYPYPCTGKSFFPIPLLMRVTGNHGLSLPMILKIFAMKKYVF